MGKLLAITTLICIVAIAESHFSCEKQCPNRRVKICDQYGVRYRNLCEFQKAKKCAGGDPRLVKNRCQKFGRNRQSSNVNCALSSSEELPAGCRNRHQNKNQGKGVTVAPPQTTQLITNFECNENCPLVFEPVCGNNGITYPSKCVLDALSCTEERDAILAGVPHTKLVAVSAGQCPIPTENPTVG